jgi:hypothetical protein
MKKSVVISLVILMVLDVKADAHALSTFGVFFTGVGFIAGFYFLLKDDKDKSHEEHENSQH